MNKKIIIISVMVAGVSFYGGTLYGKSSATAQATADRQARMTQGGAGASGQRGARNGGGFVTGQVVSKDAGSMVLGLRDGGSKNVFFSTSTQVTKSTAGSLNDLVVGMDVSINGSANSDGSVTAQSVQLRPAMPMVTPATTTK